jgi:uncharacterized Zn finger protein
MSIPSPDETRIQAALEQLNKDDLQLLIQRMVRQHPDLAGLIVSGEQEAVKKPREPFNAEVYRLQVEKIFRTTDRNTWGSEARAADPLLDIVDIADEYVEQGGFNDAVTLYEIIIRGYLLSIRRLYQKMGKSNVWTTYIADLRERNAKLPALRDEMAKAKL